MDINLNFHQTFYANLEYISKILAISNKQEMSVDDISCLTGIPTGKSSGKVLPHIYYAQYMNLIDIQQISGKFILMKTKLGEKISIEDPYISENLTKLICHYFLSSKTRGARQWFYQYRLIQEKYGKNVNELIFKNDVESYFSKKIKLGPFHGCYINNASFSSLHLVLIDNGCYQFKDFHENNEYFFGILYCLLEELGNIDNNRNEFTENEIFDYLCWNRAFNWSKIEAIKFIEKANNKGYLKLNRQLSPITIITKVTTDSILNNLYSLLL